MNEGKKINYKKIVLPAAFVVFLVLTIVFHQWAYSQNKEALGTEVRVKVTDVKVNGSGLNPGGLKVTVSYNGESYRLKGVPSSDHFIMENSRKYHTTVSAKLYDGKLYYKSTSIMLLSDKLYYASLVATVTIFGIMFVQWKQKPQR